MWYYFIGIIIAIDVLLNAILGGQHYTTISFRIGVSILSKGWASRVPWPNWLRVHFVQTARGLWKK